jgi:hypothetical protein
LAKIPSEHNAKEERAPAKKASGAPKALAVRHGDRGNRLTRSQPQMWAMGDRQASVRSSVNMAICSRAIDPDHPEPGRGH